MVKTSIEAVFNESVETIWSIVTDLTNAKWRSDLSRIDICDDQKSFIEYTKQGVATKFTITTFEPLTLYAFTMDNANIFGNWTGEFYPLADLKTKIIFTEIITPKKRYLTPFVKGYLKKQQKQYVDDLTKYLAVRQ